MTKFKVGGGKTPTPKSLWRFVFGESLFDMPAWAYNSIIGIIGCALYADTLAQFFGMAMILESVLVSIERCWPRGERPE